MKKRWIILSAVLWILTGCAPVPEVEDIQPDETEVGQVSTPEENMKATSTPSEPEAEHPTSVLKATTAPVKDAENPSPVLDETLKSLINQAKDDLSERLGVDVSAINLVSAKAVSWPDASLGCPQPGMAYIQVPEDGAQIILQVEEILYAYHSGGSRGLFLCEKGAKGPYVPPQLDILNLTPSVLDKNNPTPATPDNGIPPNEDL